MVSKRRKALAEKVNRAQAYKLEDAIALVKECATAKFDETVDLCFNLGIDPRKSDQLIRGSIVLPKGTGRKIRVAVFTQGPNADAARAAGADVVGFEDLAEQVKQGQVDFDIVIASPDAMRVVGQLGQVLGPRGLMPNPKDGTVSANVSDAVKNAKAGQVRYRTEKNGLVHAVVGKASFSKEDLSENIRALVAAIRKAKPSSAKGIFMKKITVSSTMGPGIPVDITTID